MIPDLPDDPVYDLDAPITDDHPPFSTNGDYFALETLQNRHAPAARRAEAMCYFLEKIQAVVIQRNRSPFGPPSRDVSAMMPDVSNEWRQSRVKGDLFWEFLWVRLLDDDLPIVRSGAATMLTLERDTRHNSYLVALCERFDRETNPDVRLSIARAIYTRIRRVSVSYRLSKRYVPRFSFTFRSGTMLYSARAFLLAAFDREEDAAVQLYLALTLAFVRIRQRDSGPFWIDDAVLKVLLDGFATTARTRFPIKSFFQGAYDLTSVQLLQFFNHPAMTWWELHRIVLIIFEELSLTDIVQPRQLESRRRFSSPPPQRPPQQRPPIPAQQSGGQQSPFGRRPSQQQSSGQQSPFGQRPAQPPTSNQQSPFGQRPAQPPASNQQSPFGRRSARAPGSRAQQSPFGKSPQQSADERRIAVRKAAIQGHITQIIASAKDSPIIADRGFSDDQRDSIITHRAILKAQWAAEAEARREAGTQKPPLQRPPSGRFSRRDGDQRQRFGSPFDGRIRPEKLPDQLASTYGPPVPRRKPDPPPEAEADTGEKTPPRSPFGQASSRQSQQQSPTNWLNSLARRNGRTQFGVPVPRRIPISRGITTYPNLSRQRRTAYFRLLNVLEALYACDLFWEHESTILSFYTGIPHNRERLGEILYDLEEFEPHASTTVSPG